MTDPFHTNIRSALANPGLQSALDANAERRIQARQAAAESLPEDLQTLRQQAHAVRLEVITHLDRYLGQFIERAETNGFRVQRAADAVEAIRQVLEIAGQHKARRIAKSKTMVSEEINLNQALEAAGLEAIETDLGEFIVQLRGEHPAHIITPAVHLRRADVGRTFEEKLGLPFTEDIPTMTAAARRVLRETFLTADIGLSGVNFGVAETGGICLLTNEGNGRMVTTVPPVHIALMGIERLVPTLDDLALMLALLPRHATGQKLTVYTSLIHGPRRPEDPDGPAERHLILVDNGRNALRGGPLADALLCIRCGACLNACPVFREIGGHAYVGDRGQASAYPGPIGSVVSPALFGQPEFAQLARASSLCGACKEACPVDIDLPKLLLRVRAGGQHIETRRTPQGVPAPLAAALRAFAWIATHPGRFAVAQKLAAAGSRVLAPFSSWLRFPAATGWGYSKDFPRPAAKTFRDRWAQRERVTQSLPHSEEVGRAGLAALPGSQSTVHEHTGNPSAAVPTHPFETWSPMLLERFTSELVALGGQVTVCKPQELAARILALLEARGITRLQAWETACLPSGLRPVLEAAGIQVQTGADPSLLAGLTGALAGIAETGTLVLPGGPGQPLTASLLPEIHLAVLPVASLCETLGQALQLPEVRAASAAALVTGPSRTADIEMTLTIGVHGPGEVHVFCLE